MTKLDEAVQQLHMDGHSKLADALRDELRAGKVKTEYCVRCETHVTNTCNDSECPVDLEYGASND